MTDLTVIIPVFNEDVAFVTKTSQELQSLGCHVIVVDDGSHMDFPQGFEYITYSMNMGYGYAIKQGLQVCTTPIVCTMDGDGQHLIDDIKKLYNVYKLRDSLKMVIGQRYNYKEHIVRKLGRKVLNLIASIITGHYLSDLNSGLRVMDTALVKAYSQILCDTFSFTTSLTIAMVADNYEITCFPIDIQGRKFGKSKVNVIKDGFVTLWYILYCGIGCRTRRIRRWMRNLRGLP